MDTIPRGPSWGGEIVRGPGETALLDLDRASFRGPFQLVPGPGLAIGLDRGRRRLGFRGRSRLGSCRRNSRFARAFRGQLEDHFIFLDEVQFPADTVLDHFRIMLQAIDGAGQPGILLGEPGILLLQVCPFLPETESLIQAPVSEKQDHGHHSPQNQDKSCQELMASLGLWSFAKSIWRSHGLPPHKTSRQILPENFGRCNKNWGRPGRRRKNYQIQAIS